MGNEVNYNEYLDDTLFDALSEMSEGEIDKLISDVKETYNA